ncbi:septin 7 [Nannochloropsis oceanica]
MTTFTPSDAQHQLQQQQEEEQDGGQASFFGVMSYHSQTVQVTGGEERDGDGKASDEDDESKMSASSLSSQSFPSPSSSALSAFMHDHQLQQQQQRQQQQQQQQQQGAEGDASSSSTSTPSVPLPPLPGTAATATVPVPLKKRMDESIGDEYQRIAAQKARGEQRLAAMTASKEHARRKFPQMRRVYTDYHLKVMVAGEAGHGKTTFINNMFSSYTQGRDVKEPPLPHDGSRTKTSDFLADPSGLCTRFTVTNEEALERVHYTIQDTPGFGDDTDICRSIDMILNYIDDCNQTYLEAENDTSRMQPLGQCPGGDARVDVCLYFLAAHRLKWIDIRFMQAISAKVALIPLLAKADSMTADETLAFRSLVHKECLNHKIRLFDFGQEAKQRVGIPPDLVVPPFAVVASNQFDEVRGSGSFWPVRDYRWGTCEAFSTEHSDCTYLKKLLLEEGFHDLRQATDERYMVFRRTFYQAERAAAAETAATDKRRRQQWMLVSACLLGLWIVSSLVRTISGGGGGRWEGRAGGEGAVEGMQWNVTQAGGEREGRGGGGFSIWGGKSPADLHALSSRLEEKEAALVSAEHKIALLVKSVHELEETTARLLTHKTKAQPSLPSSLASSSFLEEMSAKSLSEITDLLEALGFTGGGLLQSRSPSSPATSPPTSDSQNGREGEKEGEATLPSSPEARQRHAYKKRQKGRGGKEGGKAGCAVMRWWEGVGQYHGDYLQEGWRRFGRWFS